MDPLDRFVAAQADSWRQALAELRGGRKTSHWMWWIFPQIAGLGRSETAQYYAIADLAEAKAYLAHPVLGPRLLEATTALMGASTTKTAEAMLGGIDAIKLRSSMTLFACADPDQPLFRAALDRFFGGRRDAETLRRFPPGAAG